MTIKSKPIPEMNAEEYFDYLLTLTQEEFMRAVAHDIRKVVSVVHGYLSLIELDVAEDTIEAEKLEFYVKEMSAMLTKAYLYLDTSEDAYYERD
ncbi:MAG: hypothetical protein Q9P01_15750 [Anaerolineae bacterium]|nr:hypothetical protein [Anaerolineae bacterium]MDQ7036224.1 hypothetical protein [Anaerolineae bacterium]